MPGCKNAKLISLLVDLTLKKQALNQLLEKYLRKNRFERPGKTLGALLRIPRKILF